MQPPQPSSVKHGRQQPGAQSQQSSPYMAPLSKDLRFPPGIATSCYRENPCHPSPQHQVTLASHRVPKTTHGQVCPRASTRSSPTQTSAVSLQGCSEGGPQYGLSNVSLSPYSLLVRPPTHSHILTITYTPLRVVTPLQAQITHTWLHSIACALLRINSLR